MTGAATDGPPDAAAEEDERGPASVPAAERGSTRIADRVLAKIAAQAAREALRERRGPHAPPPGTDTAPHADVSVRQRTARVRVAVELGYPSDIGAQCGAVRRRVAARVEELTGMAVPEVAVGVERLHSAHLDGDAPRRVE